MAKKEKWVRIADADVQSIWVKDERCKEDGCEGKDKVALPPTFYADSGTPLCSSCDLDMVYSHTEIKQSDAERKLAIAVEAFYDINAYLNGIGEFTDAERKIVRIVSKALKTVTK
jgi:hypothetical protein